MENPDELLELCKDKGYGYNIFGKIEKEGFPLFALYGAHHLRHDLILTSPHR